MCNMVFFYAHKNHRCKVTDFECWRADQNQTALGIHAWTAASALARNCAPSPSERGVFMGQTIREILWLWIWSRGWHQCRHTMSHYDSIMITTLAQPLWIVQFQKDQQERWRMNTPHVRSSTVFSPAVLCLKCFHVFICVFRNQCWSKTHLEKWNATHKPSQATSSTHHVLTTY